jgi:hypothetical protein
VNHHFVLFLASKNPLIMRRINHPEPAAARLPEVALNQPVVTAEAHLRPRAVRRLRLKMSEGPRTFTAFSAHHQVAVDIRQKVGEADKRA